MLQLAPSNFQFIDLFISFTLLIFSIDYLELSSKNEDKGTREGEGITILAHASIKTIYMTN